MYAFCFAWHARRRQVVNSGVPLVENEEEGVRVSGRWGEVVISFFFALVSYVGIAIYTVYTFIQASRLFPTHTTHTVRERQKRKATRFFLLLR